MNLVRHVFRNRVLLSILIPVIGAGLIISLVSLSFFAPSLMNHLKNSSESHLTFASKAALGLCEDRLTYLVQMKLENDPYMNSALREETIQEIKTLGKQLHDVHLAVLDEQGNLLGSSISAPEPTVHVPQPGMFSGAVTVQQWGNETVRIHFRHFPFWRWIIASFVIETDYAKPVLAARKVVYVGTFGVLGVVILTLFVAFYFMVNVPLRKVVRATQNVAAGRLEKLYPVRRDEIGQLALAFDSMVDSLEQNRERINTILSQLRESEEQYRLVTEHSLASIAMFQSGKIIFANTRASDRTGYGRSEITGMDAEQVVHPEDRTWVLEKISRLERGEIPPEHFEFRCITKNGETFWQEMLAVPITYKGKQVVLGHAIDITARKLSELDKQELEAELQQAKKMEAVGTLAGGIAHDFNNLLQAIHGYAELLLMQDRDNDADQKKLENILGAARRGTELTRQLLTFGRKVETKLQPVDLNAQIEEVRELLDRTIPKMVRIELALAPDLKMINGDPLQIQRVLLNLVVNAKDAMPEGGTLRIRTASVVLDRAHWRARPDMKPGQYILLTIADTGCGMEQGVREHIFEPFFTTKALGKGTGLGLSTVYGTISNWGGAISCESQPGQGTTFEILLPAVDRPDLATQSPIDETLPRGTETILLVDDEPLIRELGQTMLSMFGYTVLPASDGRQALETYTERGESISLVILDVMMPEMGGSQCLQALINLNPRAKVLLASGYHPEGSGLEEIHKLSKGFIKKPYDMTRLLKTVRYVIDSA
jgi:PAS domain S-box-containing protein